VVVRALVVYVRNNQYHVSPTNSIEGQLSTTTKTQDITYKFQCHVVTKVFDSLHILKYHILLEHSESRRLPIGIG
jgi:hypothetical protein